MKIVALGFLHFVLGTSIAVAPSALHAASLTCKTPDQSFKAFLSKFKSDREFNEQRVVYPLKEDFIGNVTLVSRVDYRKNGYASRIRKTTVVPQQRCKAIDRNGQCADADFLRKGTCEFPPVVDGELAVVKVFECGEEAFGADYRFSLKSGCWYLSELFVYGN